MRSVLSNLHLSAGKQAVRSFDMDKDYKPQAPSHKLISSMFVSSLWDVEEPTHYSRRVGDEVAGVVAVLCEYMGGWV